MSATPPSLPIFPLGNVLYPGGLLHLNIFEPRYLAMTAACLAAASPFGVCLIAGGFEVGAPAVPHPVGCSARILEWEQPAPDRYRLVARGETRFRLQQRRADAQGLLQGTVEWIEPHDPQPLPTRYRPLAALIAELADQLGPEAPLPKPLRLDDASWVAYRWAELLPVTPERRQRWLEADDALVLLAEIAEVLAEASGDEGEAGS